ncbi:MAG: putative two-component system sensor kinase [Frankiales bacterium]|nr:putative two-component system sensor kinase [Frankiales bacterium]
MRLDTALWRAIAVYRLAALLYAAVSMAVYTDTYARPLLGWAVLAGMAVWTGLAAYLYGDPRRRGWSLLVADLGLTVAALMSSVLVMTARRIEQGDPTLTVSWAAAPVIAWAVHRGWAGGAVAAVVVGGAAVVERGGASQATVNSLVLLLLVGTVVGYVVQLARRAEVAYAQAVQLQAATAERERLSRSVHDGVLQALALVSRRASDPALAAVAAEQETALRRLVAGPAVAVPAGEADLRPLLPSGADLQVASPASPVLLPAGVAAELAAAVAAAVDNARRHGGGSAWLLVEDEPDAVTVTVRDDGPGIPQGRLEEAARAGRLGVAQSIRGRVEDLGGTVCVESTPGQGTEVELRVPRS